MTVDAERMKLVLFDIDGTILLSDGAGRRAIHRALTEFFGCTGPADYRFDGKTDRQIVRDLMRLEGHGDDHIDARMGPLLARYVECLDGELGMEGYSSRLLDGVEALLTALESRDDVILGLLTGNVEPGARAKLRAVGLDPDRFTVGAFGSDHEHRPELPAIAQQRARDELGIDVPGADIVVIGDTPADIRCGEAIGARAIGVATGRYSVAQLAEHDPYAVFETLADTDAVLRRIMNA